MLNYEILSNVKAVKAELIELAGNYGEFHNLYIDDVNDVDTAIALYEAADPQKLAKHIDEMDTAPREELIVAFANDLGKDFVADVLGYEVR
jgi:hypothetical protein